jgi:hypothetical protein
MALSETEFVNVYGAQESIQRNRYSSLCIWRAGTKNSAVVYTGPPGWESIPGLIKRFTNTGSEVDSSVDSALGLKAF